MNTTGMAAIGTDASRETGSRLIGTATNTIPRHPTALFYNNATRAQAIDEYNWFYAAAPAGSGACGTTVPPCITPLTADSQFDSYIVPTDAAFDLGFILSNDPRPFYAHATNLTGGVSALAYPLLELDPRHPSHGVHAGNGCRQPHAHTGREPAGAPAAVGDGQRHRQWLRAERCDLDHQHDRSCCAVHGSRRQHDRRQHVRVVRRRILGLAHGSDLLHRHVAGAGRRHNGRHVPGRSERHDDGVGVEHSDCDGADQRHAAHRVDVHLRRPAGSPSPARLRSAPRTPIRSVTCRRGGLQHGPRLSR